MFPFFRINTMAKTIAVVGATGIQGGSVVRALRKDYTVTAITRDSQSTAAQKLALDGVRVVQADLDDIESLKAAFVGAQAIFAVTNFFEPFAKVGETEAIEIEYRRGINLAKAAAATPGLEHYIWSTLPNAARISNGEALVPHYLAKNKVDDYIKSDPSLLKKTTFLWVTCYASNINYPFYQPFPIPTAGDNKYIQLQGSPSWVPIQSIGDARVNVGLFVRSALQQPGKSLPGNTVLGAVECMTAGEMLSAWAKAHGKDAEYVMDKEAYYRMWPKWAEVMDKSHMYWGLVKGKSFSGEDVILTKEDLAIDGLVDTASAFVSMRG